MSRLSRFHRDFADLHGHPPFLRGRGMSGVEIASDPPGSQLTLHRVTVGLLGLFWAIVLLVVLAGALIVAGVMAVAAFS